MQNFGVTNKEHYGMSRYFLEWSIAEEYIHANDVIAYVVMEGNNRNVGSKQGARVS